MKLIYFSFITCFVLLGCKSRSMENNWESFPKMPQDKILINFMSSDEEVMRNSDRYMLELGKSAIPFLIKNIENENFNFPINSDSNDISPIQVLDSQKIESVSRYEINMLVVRSGRMIEKIAFKNFGFKKIMDNPSKIDSLSKINIEKLDVAIGNVSGWWKGIQDNWTCLKGLEDALKSNEQDRQVSAMFYIQFPYYKIENFSNNYYDKRIKKLVKELLQSSNRAVKNEAEKTLDKTQIKMRETLMKTYD